MNLKELGLSDYESRAFEATVKLGKASAIQISRLGRVSYGRIYEVLASLENKGLVKVVPEKTKKFIPADPENLNKLIEEKEKILSSLREDVKKLEQFYHHR